MGSNGSGTGAIVLAFLVMLSVALYFLPAIIAHSRKTISRGTATVVDIFLGWTFIGWVIALAMAFGPTEPRNPADLEREQRVRNGEAERLRRKAAIVQ